jgi:hypothetical protein
VDSDHKCVSFYCSLSADLTSGTDCSRITSRRRVKVCTRRDGDMARLNIFLSSYNWNSICLGIDNGTITVDDSYLSC